MLMQAPQAIESFVQEPEVVGAGLGISKGWTDYGDLVVWEQGVAEGVFSVALLEDASFLDGLGGEEP